MNAHDDHPRHVTRPDSRVLSPQAFEAASLALFASAFRRRGHTKPVPVARAHLPQPLELQPPILASEWRDPAPFRLCWQRQHSPAQALRAA